MDNSVSLKVNQLVQVKITDTSLAGMYACKIIGSSENINALLLSKKYRVINEICYATVIRISGHSVDLCILKNLD